MSTYAEILDLIASSSSRTIDLQDNRATLTLAQAQSLVAQGIVFASGDTIRVLDDAATIETLTPADIVDLKNLGVGTLVKYAHALGGSVSIGINASRGTEGRRVYGASKAARRRPSRTHAAIRRAGSRRKR